MIRKERRDQEEKIKEKEGRSTEGLDVLVELGRLLVLVGQVLHGDTKITKVLRR